MNYHPNRAQTPNVVRVPISTNDQCIACAVLDSARTGLIVFEALIDTGANNSYITHDVARRLGLRLHKMTYSNTTRSGTGVSRFAGFTAPDLSLVEDPRMRSGGFVCVDDVKIGVLEADTLARSIIGMDYLRRLRGWHYAAGALVLQG